ncbi:MAG: GAF and ANTAR domain-containing protein [Acidothermaceae bacterium]
MNGTRPDPAGRGRPSPQDTGSTTGQDQLAVRLSDLARDLQQQDDPDETMASIVSAAITAIPGVDEASISVVIARRRAESHAASGELPKRIDELQSKLGEGPCLDAAYEEQTVRVPDMRTEQRWPEFSRRAYEAGAGSMLSFQLYVEEDNLGALNLYAHEPNAFDDESEHIGLLFAAHAAVAYAGAQKQEQLRIGMSSRDIIGQAKGILMERHNLSADQAFRVLIRASQDRNQKLLHIAEQVVQSRPR